MVVSRRKIRKTSKAKEQISSGKSGRIKYKSGSKTQMSARFTKNSVKPHGKRKMRK